MFSNTSIWFQRITRNLGNQTLTRFGFLARFLVDMRDPARWLTEFRQLPPPPSPKHVFFTFGTRTGYAGCHLVLSATVALPFLQLTTTRCCEVQSMSRMTDFHLIRGNSKF